MSTRQYFVVGFEYGHNVTDGADGIFTIRLEDLFNLSNDSTELEITLAEQLDDCILDLKVNESAFVKLIRDHKDSKGVIYRTR